MNEFEKLGLSTELVTAIAKMGFETPTPIQQQSIPRLLQGDTDLVGLAQTGTGKTAAFGLPLIDLVDLNQKHVQALILAPTRELCLQITKELLNFATEHKGIKITSVYGGVDIGKQIREIKRGVHIIAATPGRLRDLIRRNVADLTQVRYLVLDEADEMLNMGFKEEIDDILTHTPEEKKTWLFSATMPAEVRRIARSYMTDPFEVSVGHKNTSNLDIEHQYVFVRSSVRYEALLRFLDFDADIFGLVFTRTRRDAKDLADKLSRDGYNADALHGDMNQQQRDRVMEKFRQKRIQILAATDVAARGIDVNEITHVFHYNIPEDVSFYTHRSGRTGRAGNKGVSLVLAHPKDKGQLRNIERKVKIDFKLAHIPDGEEIVKQRLISRLRKFKETEISPKVAELMPIIEEEMAELSKEELIQIMATVSFKRLLKTYSNADDLNNIKGQKRTRSEGRFVKLFINIGRMDIDRKGDLIEIINYHSKVPGSAIGKIRLERRHSFFDVEEDIAKTIVKSFKDTNMDGRAIRVNIESRSGGGGGGGGRRRDDRKKKDWKKKKKHRGRSKW